MKIKPHFQCDCTLTSFYGDTVWKTLRAVADYLEQENNSLSGIEPTCIDVKFYEDDDEWVVSLITDYEV